MRKIASWIPRAPFPYSPQGDETIRYILYGVSRTFSSYCRILDSKGPFSCWIQLCRVYVSSNAFEIVPSQLLPPFFFFFRFFTGQWTIFTTVLARQSSFLWRLWWQQLRKKKRKKRSSKKHPYVQNNTSLADMQTTPKYLLLQISLWIPSTWTHSTIFIRHESCMDFWYDSLISIAAPMTTLE